MFKNLYLVISTIRIYKRFYSSNFNTRIFCPLFKSNNIQNTDTFFLILRIQIQREISL